MFQTAQWSSLLPALLANLAAGLFILPFFLFSATIGQLADKYDKALLARLVKVLEIVIMLLVAAGFWLHNLALLMACLFLLGLQSTFFDPVKGKENALNEEPVKTPLPRRYARLKAWWSAAAGVC